MMEVHQAVAAGAGAGGCGGSGSYFGEFLARWADWLLLALCSFRRGVAGFGPRLARIARDDPRRVVHSFKVGMALTVVSVIYYVRPMFNGWGLSTLWAVLTVVVVMEYTVGGTLMKGLNRAAATLVAGFLAVGAHKVADMGGPKAEPVILAIFVFVLASVSTFMRFIPQVKARYDYGVTIFILTFSLVAVSSYRVDQLIRLAHQRFTTIATGVGTCLFTTVFVRPVWAGEDLHKLAAANLDKLADFFEGLEAEFFREGATRENLETKGFLQVYKSILNSKAIEDTLCNFAKWEPGHGKFKFRRHPWSQYQRLGAVTRQCASSMDALCSYIITITKAQYPEPNPEACSKVRTECGEMSLLLAKALRELSAAIRTMTAPSPAKTHMTAAVQAAKDLKDEIAEDENLAKAMHVAVTASLLAELVAQTKKIRDSVDTLARLAHFKIPEDNTDKDDAVVINVVS